MDTHTDSKCFVVQAAGHKEDAGVRGAELVSVVESADAPLANCPLLFMDIQERERVSFYGCVSMGWREYANVRVCVLV